MWGRTGGAFASIAGTNLEHARSHNRRVVIETVRLHGPLSRAEIARLTGLTSQTVSNIADELQEGASCVPMRRGSAAAASRQRRSRSIPTAPIPSACNSDHHGLTAVLVDLAGAGAPPPHHARARSASGDRGGADGAQRARPSQPRADRLVARAGRRLAMPGPFNAAGRRLMGPTSLPGWEDPEVDRIAERIGLPLLIENDAKAAAIGEHLHGRAKHLSSFVYLFIGMGLGTGLFVDGHVYKGAGRNAGEIGHNRRRTQRPALPLRNRGCLERYVSLRAAYETLGIDSFDRNTPDELARRLEAGDKAVVGWLTSTRVRCSRRSI